MKTLRLGIIGLGQRIAHVLKACADLHYEHLLAAYDAASALK